MKFKVVSSKKKKAFEPFTIEITAENSKELQSLWHRFNASEKFGQQGIGYSDTEDCKEASMETFVIWKAIDNELEKYENDE